MAQATWNGVLLAESDETIVVEGNHYFPREAINSEYLVDSPRHTTCAWKGVASYYDIEVEGQSNKGAAFYYPSPSAAAADIKDYVAFWRGVRISA